MQNDPINIFTADITAMDSILDKYPWFTTARIRRSAISGAPDPRLALMLLTRPWPSAMLYEVSGGPAPGGSCPDHDNTTRIIERFLAAGDNKKVVPKEDTPTEDVSEDSSVFVPDEELDTEELERIYRDQGLELMDYDVAEITGEVLGIVDDE